MRLLLFVCVLLYGPFHPLEDLGFSFRVVIIYYIVLPLACLSMRIS
jgi:hypothetical protein